MKTINITMIHDSLLNAPLALRQAGASEPQIEDFVAGKLNPVLDLLQKGSKEISGALNDANLSSAGKKTKASEIAQTYFIELETLKVGVDRKYKDYSALLNRKLEVKKDNEPDNPVLDFLQQQEIRNVLSGMEPADVSVLYFEAV